MQQIPVVRGIVLAGNYHWSESSFEQLAPRSLLPVAQAPLISYVLRWLRDGGLPSATVCANGSSPKVRKVLGNGSAFEMKLDYYEDTTPRGAAGCARDAALESDADTFVICDGTAIPAVDLRALLQKHRDTGAAVTVVVHHDGASASVGPRPFTPGGIYVFERRVFDHVPESSFQDIKESLIPKLNRLGEKVVTHVGEGVCPRILDAGTYIAVNEWMIQRVVEQSGGLPGYRLVRGGVLAHHTARIDPLAMMLGPVLVGPGARILAGATVVGPTAIGADSCVSEGALVSRSVVWDRCFVGKDSVVDRCLLSDEAMVDPGKSLFSVLRTADGRRAPRPAVAAAHHALAPDLTSAEALFDLA